MVLTVESVLCTCIAYLADSDTIEKWSYWPDIDTESRIGAVLVENSIYFNVLGSGVISSREP